MFQIPARAFLTRHAINIIKRSRIVFNSESVAEEFKKARILISLVGWISYSPQNFRLFYALFVRRCMEMAMPLYVGRRFHENGQTDSETDGRGHEPDLTKNETIQLSGARKTTLATSRWRSFFEFTELSLFFLSFYSGDPFIYCRKRIGSNNNNKNMTF